MKLSIGADEEQDVELDFSKATPVSIKTSPFDEAEILKSSSENGVFTFQYVNTFKKFSEGLAAIERDGKQGYINKEGKNVIPCRYESAHNFSEGLAAKEWSGKWGFVDKTGKEVIPCIYKDVGDFSEGYAQVQRTWDGQWGFIDKNGTYGWIPENQIRRMEAIEDESRRLL